MEDKTTQMLIDVPTLAVKLSISPWTVRALVRDGKLKPTRIGRRVLFEQAEIDNFLQCCKAAN